MLRKVLLILLLLPVTGFAASVDLLWQASTYTPPFYEGKALWSNQSTITFTAIPQGFTNPSSLIYRWSKDDAILGNSSGVNKRSLTIYDTPLSLPVTVKVELLTAPDTEPVAENTVALKPSYVRLLAYEDNPLYGLMLNNEIGNSFAMKEQEVSFAAIPLYGQVTTRLAPAYTYTWLANGSDTRTGNKVTYRAPDGASGSSSIVLKANDSRVVVEPGDKTFNLSFDFSNNGF